MIYSANDLATNPVFIRTLGHLARSLRAAYNDNPRLSRLMASHQRWLISQAAVALHFEYDPEVPGSGLTSVALKEAIAPRRIASRNTVLSFLDQATAYKFAERVPVKRRGRARRYEVTDIAEDAMFGWYAANLAALDHLDNGSRAGDFISDPDIFRLAQPRAAWACLADDEWREPPKRVAEFLWTESGGLVMDEMIARIEIDDCREEKLRIGIVDARALAEHFMMSRTHLQRLLRRAVDQGSIGWYDDTSKGEMWFARDFLREYSGWQARKFAAVNDAYFWARDRMQPEKRSVSGASH